MSARRLFVVVVFFLGSFSSFFNVVRVAVLFEDVRFRHIGNDGDFRQLPLRRVVVEVSALSQRVFAHADLFAVEEFARRNVKQAQDDRNFRSRVGGLLTFSGAVLHNHVVDAVLMVFDNVVTNIDDADFVRKDLVRRNIGADVPEVLVLVAQRDTVRFDFVEEVVLSSFDL